MAEQPPNEFMTPEEVCALLVRSPNALRKDRQFRRGLPFVRVGQAARYRRSDVYEYIERNTVDPIS